MTCFVDGMTMPKKRPTKTVTSAAAVVMAAPVRSYAALDKGLKLAGRA